MGHGHHNPDCDHHHHGDQRRLLMALAIIGTFMVVEIVGGIISGSLALLADAGHMATDAMALGLAVFAKWMAGRQATDRMSFGYQRVQVLAAFVNGLALIALVGWLVVEAVLRFINPQEILTGYMLVVAVLGLAANIVAFLILHGGNTQDLNMRGAMLHVMADIFGSVAAIGSALLIAWFGIVQLDPLLTLIVCGLIVRSALPLLREAGHILLQGAPADVTISDVREAVRSAVPLIKEIHDVNIWMLTPDMRQLSMHISVARAEDSQIALDQVKTLLTERYGIEASTIQVEWGQRCPDITARSRNDEESDSRSPTKAEAENGKSGQDADRLGAPHFAH